jgi:capsular polysaccharide biosynthesis protein
VSNSDRRNDQGSRTQDDIIERLWNIDDLSALDFQARADDGPAGLVTLSYLKAAVKRRWRLWCGLALVGLVLGAGTYKALPVPYTATASVLLRNGPTEDATQQIDTDAALAQSDAVASGVVKQLGLTESAPSFRSSYTITIVTDQMLTFTANSSSAADAVNHVAAIANYFLEVRSQYALIQEQQQAAQLDEEVAQAQADLDSINAKIAQTSQPGQQLRDDQNNAQNSLNSLENYAAGAKAQFETATKAMIKSSQIINAAAVQKRSRIRRPAEYVVGGLIGGLVLGLAIVVISAITSDRLRRRGDVADILKLPVGLSVGPVRRRRFSLGKGASRPEANARRVTAYLRSKVSKGGGAGALAIVAVDNAGEVAGIFARLVKSFAADGLDVVAADLSQGAPAARLLGVAEPGVRQVDGGNVNVVVAVPVEDDIAPEGPIHYGEANPPQSEWTRSVAAACSPGRVVLTFCDADPSTGLDHLATWAKDATVLVTAGRSSVARLRGAGEILRMAGFQLASVVLVGGDKTDETIGSADRKELPLSIERG